MAVGQTRRFPTAGERDVVVNDVERVAIAKVTSVTLAEEVVPDPGIIRRNTRARGGI